MVDLDRTDHDVVDLQYCRSDMSWYPDLQVDWTYRDLLYLHRTGRFLPDLGRTYHGLPDLSYRTDQWVGWDIFMYL